MDEREAGGWAGRKRYRAEQIIGMLREAEVPRAPGRKWGRSGRSLGIVEQTFSRWRREYGGLKREQAQRLKALEQETARLQRAEAELTLDKVILPEAVGGNFSARPEAVLVWPRCGEFSGYRSAGFVG